jgi:peptidoglycan hydrolase-like protein with peptidoglycan-binding domain
MPPTPPFDPCTGVYANAPYITKPTPTQVWQSNWAVTYLQGVLRNECGRLEVPCSGTFDGATAWAVVALQQFFGIVGDPPGVVGPYTWPAVDVCAIF